MGQNGGGRINLILYPAGNPDINISFPKEPSAMAQLWNLEEPQHQVWLLTVSTVCVGQRLEEAGTSFRFTSAAPDLK